MSFMDWFGPVILCMLVGVGLLILLVVFAFKGVIPWGQKFIAETRLAQVKLQTFTEVLSAANVFTTDVLTAVSDKTAALPDPLMEELIRLHTAISMVDKRFLTKKGTQ